jgi:hypothetical protein
MRGLFVILRQHDRNVIAQADNRRYDTENSEHKSKGTDAGRIEQPRNDRARNGRDQLRERRPTEQSKALLD